MLSKVKKNIRYLLSRRNAWKLVLIYIIPIKHYTCLNRHCEGLFYDITITIRYLPETSNFINSRLFFIAFSDIMDMFRIIAWSIYPLKKWYQHVIERGGILNTISFRLMKCCLFESIFIMMYRHLVAVHSCYAKPLRLILLNIYIKAIFNNKILRFK